MFHVDACEIRLENWDWTATWFDWILNSEFLNLWLVKSLNLKSVFDWLQLTDFLFESLTLTLNSSDWLSNWSDFLTWSNRLSNSLNQWFSNGHFNSDSLDFRQTLQVTDFPTLWLWLSLSDYLTLQLFDFLTYLTLWLTVQLPESSALSDKVFVGSLLTCGSWWESAQSSCGRSWIPSGRSGRLWQLYAHFHYYSPPERNTAMADETYFCLCSHRENW